MNKIRQRQVCLKEFIAKNETMDRSNLVVTGIAVKVAVRPPHQVTSQSLKALLIAAVSVPISRQSGGEEIFSMAQTKEESD